MRLSRVGTSALPVLLVSGHVSDGEDVARLADAVRRAAADAPDVVACDLRAARHVEPALVRLGTLSAELEQWPACHVFALVSAAALRRVDRSGFGPLMHVSALPRALALLGDTTDRHRASLRLESSVQAPAVARRFVSAVLQGWGREGDTAVVTLVLGELVTNAVLHAMTPVDLTVLELPSGLAVAVGDAAPGDPHVVEDSVDAERGRGLQLVRSLSTAWGTMPRSGGGKTVWAVCG